MKKLFLIVITTLLVNALFAQTSDKKWGIGLGAGAYGNLNNSSVGLMPELYFSRYLSPKLDLMLKSDMGIFNSKINNDLDLFNPTLNLRYKLSDESKKLRPYLYGGPGFLADNTETGVNFGLGIGGKYYFRPATALYLETGYINGIKTTVAGKSDRDNFLKATLGIEFDFGKAKDSDMDGVPDRKDKCPNTPAGVAVDINGCPVDSDGDGVADFVDECPGVAGVSALKGCPDKDGDGIADKDDLCPAVAGLALLKGCPDTDGDGVTDKDDKCPGTIKGVKVDENGCELDQDKDGIPDSADKCPGVAGIKENNGCAEEKKPFAEEIKAAKMKVEPVYFETNKSTFSGQEKVKIDKLVTLLKENLDYKVQVSGYTDSDGSDGYNLSLSKHRVDNVVKSIISDKINSKRIVRKEGLGEANPASTNGTPEGKALNRRVEFEVINSK